MGNPNLNPKDISQAEQEEIERLLATWNPLFTQITGYVLVVFGLTRASLASEIRFPLELDLAEVKNAIQDKTVLTSSLSSVIGRTPNLESISKIIAQLYWLKFSLMMQTIIGNLPEDWDSASSKTELLFEHFGFARYLADAFSSAFLWQTPHEIAAGIELFQQSFTYGGPLFPSKFGQLKLAESLRIIPLGDNIVFHQSRDSLVEKLYANNIHSAFSKEKFMALNSRFNDEMSLIKAGNAYPFRQEIFNVGINSNQPFSPEMIALLQKFLALTFEANHKNASNDGINVIFHKNSDGTAFINIVRMGNSIRKYYYQPKQGTSAESIFFFLGGIVVFDNPAHIMTLHSNDAYEALWPLLYNRYWALFNLAKDEDVSKDEFLQKLGEFSFIFINIMPYQRGSAAIGEWLMQGLAKVKGIDLTVFNHEVLSWDFSAFVSVAAEPYANAFKTFFKNIEEPSKTLLPDTATVALFFRRENPNPEPNSTPMPQNK